MSEQEVSTLKKVNKLKLFVIRSTINRTMVEAFSESEDYYLGINGPENSGLGVFAVAMFDKARWERVT